VVANVTIRFARTLMDFTQSIDYYKETVVSRAGFEPAAN
jgi:hypothetical protein